MHTTRLSSKGQIIIPKAVRDAHGWVEGTEFVVEDRPEGMLIKPKQPVFKPTTLEEVIGCAGYKGPRKSLADMKAGVDAAMKERWERKRK